MTEASILPGLAGAADCSNENDSSCSDISNKSLRIAENAKKKRQAEAPLLLALKYFSQGNINLDHICLLRSGETVVSYLTVDFSKQSAVNNCIIP